MLNSKSIVFAVFAVWCVLCWRWYVCGVMNACSEAETNSTKEEVVAIPDDRINSARIEEGNDIQPLNDQKSTSGNTSNSITPTSNQSSKSISPTNMEEVPQKEVEARMVIHFPYKSSSKEDNAANNAYLAGLVNQLIHSRKKVTITGHTDFVGEPAENLALGLRRAESIRDVLVKKGVPKSQIVCKSQGDRKPVATNDTPNGRYQNNRAEIQIQ